MWYTHSLGIVLKNYYSLKSIIQVQQQGLQFAQWYAQIIPSMLHNQGQVSSNIQ